jgi:hypothetical protein
MAQTPSSSREEPRYSLTWANNVYLIFQNKYPRATEIINEHWGIDDLVPPKWLANGSPRWKRYTQLVKMFAKWDRIRPAGSVDPVKVLNGRLVALDSYVKRVYNVQ